MGLLQAAYRTYETYSHLAGTLRAEEKEPLTPVSHTVQNAQIEITISRDGAFMSAVSVPKDGCKTIMPATIGSAGRAGEVIRPHPLCDQLCYIAPFGGKKYEAYLEQLSAWADSASSHEKVCAVRSYIAGGTIINDLTQAGVITSETGVPGKGRIEGAEYAKCLVRWRVLPAPEGTSSASWQDITLFNSFTDYYAGVCADAERDLCFIAGKRDQFCESHPKGIISASFNAKLVSANDSSGFTYRGRFINAREAGSVGYTASQKAHNALKWLAANDGVYIGGRTFLCWNPEGAPVPAITMFGLPGVSARDFNSYKERLSNTLSGYKKELPPDADVVIAAFDAATTGRLSVTYFNELRGSDFLSRIERWYATCVWDSRYGIQPPTLRRIVTCAFGTQKGQFIDLDDKVLKEHIQHMLRCIVDTQPVPQDIVTALTNRAGTPLAYDQSNRETLLETACAVIRKYRNDIAHKEEWTLALDESNKDRSYLFGRLLAVCEQAERSTYDKSEGRETNAIRMQTVFSQRPLYAWRVIDDKLEPYYERMAPGLREYFKNITSSITEQLDSSDDLDKKLGDIYLLGYYHQRAALKRKKEKTNEAEENNVKGDE